MVLLAVGRVEIRENLFRGCLDSGNALGHDGRSLALPKLADASGVSVHDVGSDTPRNLDRVEHEACRFVVRQVHRTGTRTGDEDSEIGRAHV